MNPKHIETILRDAQRITGELSARRLALDALLHLHTKGVLKLDTEELVVYRICNHYLLHGTIPTAESQS